MVLVEQFETKLQKIFKWYFMIQMNLPRRKEKGLMVLFYKCSTSHEVVALPNDWMDGQDQARRKTHLRI